MIHVEAGAVGGVPRSRHDDRAYFAEGDGIRVLDRLVRESGLGGLVDDDLGTGGLGQFHVPRHEISMRMGEVDAGDLQPQFLRILQVAADVAGRINDHGFPAAANQIGVVRKDGQVVLTKHEVSGLLFRLLNQLNVGRFVAVRRRLRVTRQAGRPRRSDCEQHHCEQHPDRDPFAQTRSLHTKTP